MSLLAHLQSLNEKYKDIGKPYSLDLEFWWSLGVGTVADWERWADAQQFHSDAHKDAYGFRYRGPYLSIAEYNKRGIDLYTIVGDSLKSEREREAENLAQYKPQAAPINNPFGVLKTLKNT